MDTQFVKKSMLLDVWQWTGVLDFRDQVGGGQVPDWIVAFLDRSRESAKDMLFLEGSRLFVRVSSEGGGIAVVAEMVQPLSYIVRMPEGQLLIVPHEQFYNEFVAVHVDE